MIFEKPKTDTETIDRGFLKQLARLAVGIPTGIGASYITGGIISALVPVPAKFGMKLCYYMGVSALGSAAADLTDKTLQPVYDTVFGVTDEEFHDAVERRIHIEVEDVEHPNETATA